MIREKKKQFNRTPQEGKNKEGKTKSLQKGRRMIIQNAIAAQAER